MVTDAHTRTRTFTQGLTHLIYFSGFKPPCTEIVRSKWTASDGGNKRHNAPGEPRTAEPRRCSAATSWLVEIQQREEGVKWAEERTGNKWEQKKQRLNDF